MRQPCTAIRTVFLVIDPSRGAGAPLGTSTSMNCTFFRTDPATLAPLWSSSSTYITDGRTRIDGLDTPVSGSYRAGWQVVTWLTTDGMAADAFAVREYDRTETETARRLYMGGVKLAEVLVYDSVLDDGTRRDVETYLRQKWLGADAPMTAQAGTLALAGGTLALAADTKLETANVTSSGAVVLNGEGTLTVKDVTQLAGQTLAVTNGAVVLSGRVRMTATDIPTDALVAHFDISATETLTVTEENGTNFVTRWNDLTGQHYATADATHRPWLLKGDCNGLDVLCTGPYCKSTDADLEARKARAGWMTWDNKACAVKTVIEVIGVQEGGNFLVGAAPVGGTHILHRGGDTGRSYADAILLDGRTEIGQELYSADAFFSINGTRVARTAGFPSASYHSFAVRIDETQGTPYFYIGTFGLDRTYRWGGQRVCEVLAYNRCLTDDELARIESYLQKKWFARDYSNFTDPDMPNLDLGAGAYVDFNGETRTVARVSGEGTVTNGNLTVTERFAPEAGFAVDGTLTFAGTAGTIVVPADAFVSGASVEICACGAFAGDPSGWTLLDRAGRPLGRGKIKPRFVCTEGRLILQCLRTGTVLFFR